MKILWLDLNSSYAHSSLALPALHAQIPAHTAEWVKVSATINENSGVIAAEIFKHNPDIIAATNWLFNHEALLHILARAKALCPQCCIALGGPEFLGNNEEFLRKNTFVDCVFRGEGEENFPKWLSVWNQKEKWSSIEGLCYLNLQHQYIDNGIARMMNFANLTWPEKSEFFNWEKPFVQLETTRGCFNTCAFCVSGGEKPVRTQSLDVIRERIRTIHSHGIKNIRVLDRTFNYNNKRAKELLDIFREFSPDICFHLEIHPALLTQELKEELKTLPKGLLHLEAGIQSLREEVLEKCDRKGKLQDALEGLKFLCSLDNTETHADLIAGLPLYKLSEMMEDVRVLAGFGAGEIQLESLKLLPGTVMRKNAAELGITYSPYPPYEVLQTREISTEELQIANNLSRTLDNYYNTPAWQSITRQLLINEADFLENFMYYLTELRVIDQPLGLERRGILLYEFCKNNYPNYLSEMSMAWIEAGMSLRKSPAEAVKTKHIHLPEKWETVWGDYKESLKLAYFPDVMNNKEYWYGYETEKQEAKPTFKAIRIR